MSDAPRLNDPIRAIATLQSVVGDASRGLPEDVFLFVSRMTALVNVELLIRDPVKGYLLTWREDEPCGPGWHVPGGIIRFKETAARRIQETARRELGAEVAFEPSPTAIRECMDPCRDTRGHFISLLYRCTLETPPDPRRQFVAGQPQPGQWHWHPAWPDDIIEVHRELRQYYR